MPYPTLDSLPDWVKAMPKHAQEIYQAAWNSAFEQYKDEGKAAATAITAVETKYKKNDKGEWVAKEAKVKEADLSMDDKRTAIQAALNTKLGTPSSEVRPVGGLWVRDIFDAEIVYEMGDVTYKVSYSMDAEGKVTFGTPAKVIRQTVYKPIESLQAKYSEIIQECIKRGVSADAPQVKDALANCTKLISSDKPEETAVAQVLKEAAASLLWLREQAVTKTEDGESFPAAAYGYVPDPEKPSEWKLRLWEDPQKKVTRAQLGRAAAALSPGGFRGQKVQIPSDDLAAVKRKIRAEYAKLDVPDEEIPRWVKEAEMRQIVSEYIPLIEAKVDGSGKAQLIVIKPGFNATRERYYPAEVLARDCRIFEGVKMFADHPTESEEKSRPERSIRDWVATLHNVHPVEQGVIIGEADILEPWLKERLATLRDKGLLKDIGVSINAVGTASKAEVEGVKTNLIERLVRARSVDFVTEAGAGGQVELYEANSDATWDVDIVTLETLKERRPDLMKIVETGIRAEIAKEARAKVEIEEQLKEAKTTIEALTKERDDLKAKFEKAEQDKLIAATQAKVSEALGKATELPDAAKIRIAAKFANATSDEGLVEAIKAEVDYIATIRESGKVKGMGASNPDPEKMKAELTESFERLTGDKKKAEIAVKGR